MWDKLTLIPITVVYGVASLLLFIFGLNLVVFSLRVWRRGRVASRPPCRVADHSLPKVTVQVPIYNELYVSERIIDAVTRFDYPAELLQVQVLDDSTDETTLIIAEAVASARARGIDIVHRRRADRAGYKAGALAAGLADATGEFVAIFDADFVPPPDFLRRALPCFEPDVAFVQARWGHLNRNHSWLTRLQALAIDGHFLVEQSARGLARYWFNFNGTAGIWRVAAIHDAGGWKADTLTEDLDLSYRAHLRGWSGRYLEDLVVPAEVPVQLAGFRRQQHRWARGSLECAGRLLPSIWRSETPFIIRVQASLHLGAYFIQLLLMTLLIIYPMVVIASSQYPRLSTLYGIAYVFAIASIAPTIFFVTGSRQAGRRWYRDLPRVAVITAFGAGLMVNTARAALQIFTRPNPSFERTAKFGLESSRPETSWRLKRYQLAPDRIVFAELFFAAYAVGAATLAWRNQNWGVFVYASIFALGLSSVATVTIVDAWSLHRNRSKRALAVRAEGAALALPSTSHLDAAGSNPATVRRALVVMAKRPSAGSTKTRLAPALTLEQAAALYERFLVDTLDRVRGREDATLIVATDDPDNDGYFASIAPDLRHIQQVGETLGERLHNVMSHCIDEGFDEVYAIGSDSPDLPSGHLTCAFAALGDPAVDVVVGPTDDGGYYLIGYKQSWPRLLTDVEMSTPSVLDDTLVIAADVGATVAQAPPWYDVDDPDDLRRLRSSLGQNSSHTADFLSSL